MTCPARFGSCKCAVEVEHDVHRCSDETCKGAWTGDNGKQEPVIYPGGFTNQRDAMAHAVVLLFGFSDND